MTLDLVSVFCRRDVSIQLLQARSTAHHFAHAGLARVIYVWNDTINAPDEIGTGLRRLTGHAWNWDRLHVQR